MIYAVQSKMYGEALGHVYSALEVKIAAQQDQFNRFPISQRVQNWSSTCTSWSGTCSGGFSDATRAVADTKMVLHAFEASLGTDRIVFQSPDTDVAVVCLYAFRKMRMTSCGLKLVSKIKYDTSQYIS